MTKQISKERTWVEIGTQTLKDNFEAFHKVAKGKLIMAVVKSNAYGHGMIECAKLFTKWGSDWLGVDDIDEAIVLRREGIKKPILVLGYTLPVRFREAAKNDISLTISSIESLRYCSQIENCKLKIHLKLETGLNRQGLLHTELAEALRLLQKSELQMEGLYSHFAAAELAEQKRYRDYCNKQMNKFETMSEMIEGTMSKTLIKHMAGTSATLLLSRSRYDLVRIGIGLYEGALAWYSIVTQVKNVKKGERVGYDLTEQVKRDSKLAIVPVGYWHGYPRSASGGSGDPAKRGLALVRGAKCPIIGRISMDMMTIDVTDVRNVKQGDIVTFIGKNLSAEEVATRAGTINYEILARINPLVKRVFTQ